MAKRALALAPDLAEAHVALGVFHYYGFREYEPALTEFHRAIELLPNNSQALQFIAAVHRRQGKWNAALEELKRSLDQDPRDANNASTIAETQTLLRHWKDADEMAGHSLAIDPQNPKTLYASPAAGWGLPLLPLLEALARDDPKQSRFQMHLAQCYLALNRRDPAKQILEAGQMDVSFPKEVYTETVGGQEFYVMEALMHAPGLDIQGRPAGVDQNRERLIGRRDRHGIAAGCRDGDRAGRIGYLGRCPIRGI